MSHLGISSSPSPYIRNIHSYLSFAIASRKHFFVLPFFIPLSRGQRFNFFTLLKAFQQLCWTLSYQNNKNCILLGSIALETKASQLKGTLQCHFIIKQSTRWTACYNRCFLAPGTKPAHSKTAQSLSLSQDGSVSGTTLV